MSERCLTEDYELRGHEVEVWREDGGWWLAAREPHASALGVPADTVLACEEFKPPLTDAEVRRIDDYVFDRLSDDG